MKKQLTSILFLALLTFAACKQPEAEMVVEDEAPAMEAPDYAAFDQKVAVIRAFIKAHCAEDENALNNLISDTLKWSPPQYNGNQWLGKAELMEALKGYHAAFDNIQFKEGIVLSDTLANGMWSGSVFPESTASNSPDAIRVYGTWTATHTETGKEVGVKYFSLDWINEDGKLVMFTDYFDVAGIMAQVNKK